MLQNNLNLKDYIMLIDEAKSDKYNYDNSLFSQAQTSFSMKDSKKQEDILTSEFQEIIKPTPIIYSMPPIKSNITNTNLNFKLYNNYFNSIKINSNKKIINFMGKKRHINNGELFFKNNKTEENRIKEIENDNSLSMSAFKKIEIGKENETCNKSAFKTHVTYTKIKSIKKNKTKKKIENKIIINEMNNLNLIKNGNLNIPKKRRLFKSINYGNKGENNRENNDEGQMKRKRRGRKPNSETKAKRIHEASDYDNILRKIQVHFLTFIISFANNLVEAFLPYNKDLKFKNLSYNLKKTVNHTYVENLKNKTFGEILQFQASSKNRKFSDSINKQIFQKVVNLSPFLNNFFNMSYLQLFNNYYLKCNRTFVLEGVKVNLSQKTKLFVDLIQKNNNAADKIKQIAAHNFIESTNDIKQPIFVINKKNI